MAEIKTVQLPVDVWTKLKELAKRDDRTIASFLRTKIVELHEQAIADDTKKA